MSMNVADSTDLIHGGGGSLANFWRSRTNFEKKLLLAVTAMALVIIGMTIAVIVLAVDNNKYKSQRSLASKDPTTDRGFTANTKGLTTAPLKDLEDIIWKRGSRDKRPSTTLLQLEQGSMPEMLRTTSASSQKDKEFLPPELDKEFLPPELDKENPHGSRIHKPSFQDQPHVSKRYSLLI